MRKCMIPAWMIVLGLLTVSVRAAHAKVVGRLAHISQKYNHRGLQQAHLLCDTLNVPSSVSGNRLRIVTICTRTGRPVDSAAIRKIGGEIAALSRSFLRVRIALDSLDHLANLPFIGKAGAPMPVREQEGFGSVLSESVGLTNAAYLQQGGLTGSGVKVAVIDGGFANLQDVVDQGELPASTISKDFTGNGIREGSSHGTGVAEHVLDMAPGVSLYCLKVGDRVDLENAADYIRDNAIGIVNLSLSWYGLSYYDNTGPFNTIVNNSAANDDVFWAVAAGNDAEHHWRGIWQDADNDDEQEFDGTIERMLLVDPPEEITIFLNWDQYGASRSSMVDLDLFIVDESENIIAASTASQFVTQIPFEAAQVKLDTSKSYSLAVVRMRGNAAGLDMTIFALESQLEFGTQASSFVDPANAQRAYTVGAVWRGGWEEDAPGIQVFSGKGPTNDGRIKPDIVGPEGTSNVTQGEKSSHGTSFASPVVAGAAALLMQRFPSFTSGQIKDKLDEMAIDQGAPGRDNVYGIGMLALDSSLVTATIARQGPLLQPGLDATGKAELYNLSGQRITTIGVAGKNPARLPRGIYIVNKHRSRLRPLKKLLVAQ
ncbi:MAG: S8 family serine peptidase [Chitinivibrionales bacterium]|nr:S8 family serine peptidase [Chitinivibrionales bacterium]